MAASSLTELLFVLGVAATLASTSVAQLAWTLDSARASSAARHVAARLQEARVRAIARNRSTALRITSDARGYLVTVYEDGNRNGVTSADIQSGVDHALAAGERLPEQFPGVEFGAVPGLPGAEGSAPPGTDPIRVGVSDSVTFTPEGTATPGSLYVRGRRGVQFVVRIYGETGRTRVLGFNARTQTWH
ncbi:MAG: Tfp pilus assembly protein FimT/FimU [Vicinamibacterales bacterium]